MELTKDILGLLSDVVWIGIGVSLLAFIVVVTRNALSLRPNSCDFVITRDGESDWEFLCGRPVVGKGRCARHGD